MRAIGPVKAGSPCHISVFSPEEHEQFTRQSVGAP